MSKSRSMYAGSSGSDYGVNVNANSPGNGLLWKMARVSAYH